MHFFALFFGASLAQLGFAAYSLKDDYSGNNFVNMFNFDTVGLHGSHLSLGANKKSDG